MLTQAAYAYSSCSYSSASIEKRYEIKSHKDNLCNNFVSRLRPFVTPAVDVSESGQPDKLELLANRRSGFPWNSSRKRKYQDVCVLERSYVRRRGQSRIFQINGSEAR